jgi:hypothetical protein
MKLVLCIVAGPTGKQCISLQLCSSFIHSSTPFKANLGFHIRTESLLQEPTHRMQLLARLDIVRRDQVRQHRLHLVCCREASRAMVIHTTSKPKTLEYTPEARETQGACVVRTMHVFRTQMARSQAQAS